MLLRQMYKALDYEWASTLLAFLAILMVLIAWIFCTRGEQIRLKSPWASQVSIGRSLCVAGRCGDHR